eukprot:CAMPEP_0167763086 /NCGR_PEP_ID=MMETSP0110_2-20121227/13149_1 /TAXON_ID=629695 /ORGANISM="Gymnochlora sp., Strain CCMP2014" /LENGTH=230 /DNA_ID=CAMNT_0007650075 /DNA_START=78 /DNA_END=767 /DNA_ORIENTATION=-
MPVFKRRGVVGALGIVGLAKTALSTRTAKAFDSVPAGFMRVQSKLDGFKFYVPTDWILSKTSGNTAAYENPVDFQENLFVSISGRTKYDSIKDLGTPKALAEDIEKKLVTEFMSTRIGVRRVSDISFANERIDKDGKVYYDIGVRVRSYASRNALAVSQAAIDEAVELEFDRLFLVTLGVANDRVYELRLQTSNDGYPKSKPVLDKIQGSFEVAAVKCPSINSCTPGGAK